MDAVRRSICGALTVHPQCTAQVRSHLGVRLPHGGQNRGTSMVDCSDVFAGSIQGGRCPASVRQPSFPLAMSLLLPDFPDPALRQPATLAAVVPLFLSIYTQAVLAILPNFSIGVAKWFGFENDEWIKSWYFQFAVGAISCT